MPFTKEIMKKKDFVYKELSALLSKIDPNIKRVEYEFDENSESVKVIYEKAVIRVDVTADSMGAIVQDVLMAVM